MKLNLLVLYTDKPKKLKDFYSCFGLNFCSEKHSEIGPEHYVAVMDDGFVIELYPWTSKDPVPIRARMRLELTVDDISEVAGNLEARGIALHIKQSQDGKHAVIRDPDGSTISLKEQTYKAVRITGGERNR